MHNVTISICVNKTLKELVTKMRMTRFNRNTLINHKHTDKPLYYCEAVTETYKTQTKNNPSRKT